MTYAARASTGMLWIGFGSILAKLASFVSLIILGWFLEKEEFALYAIALSISIVFIGLRNGGLHQILMQRGESGFSVAIGAYTRYALLVNFIAMGFIILISPFVVQIYNEKILYILLLVISVSIPLGTTGYLYRSGLAVQLKFTELALLDTYSAFVRHGCTIIFAIMGLGVFSFILPLLIVPVFEHFYGKYKSGIDLLKSTKLTIFKFKRIFNKAKWVLLTSIAVVVSLQGDYFILGILEDIETVGLYFFGFQVVLSTAVIVSQGVQSVILPIMSKIKNDINRQATAFKKLTIIFVISISLLSMIFFIISPYLVKYIWNHKWDEAIPVIQILSISLVAWLIVPLSKSVLESRSRWKLVAYLAVLDGMGSIIFAVIGALKGGVVEIAIFLCLFKIIYGLIYLAITAYVLKQSISNILLIAIIPLSCAILSMFIALNAIKFTSNLESLYRMLIEVAAFLVVYIVLIFLVQKNNMGLCLEYYKSILIKKNI